MNYEEEVKKRERHLKQMVVAFENCDVEAAAFFEMKRDGFNYLKGFFGCDRGMWVDYLKSKHGDFLTVLYGIDSQLIENTLEKLWKTPYYDPDSEQEYTFRYWASVFSTEEAVQLYDDLTTLKNSWKRMYTELSVATRRKAQQNQNDQGQK